MAMHTTQLGSNYHIYKFILLSVLHFFFFVCLFFLLCKCTAGKREWQKKSCFHNWFHFGFFDPFCCWWKRSFFGQTCVTAIKSMKSNFIAGSSNISLFDRVNCKINRNVCKRKKAKNTNKWIIRKKKVHSRCFFSLFLYLLAQSLRKKSTHKNK